MVTCVSFTSVTKSSLLEASYITNKNADINAVEGDGISLNSKDTDSVIATREKSKEVWKAKHAIQCCDKKIVQLRETNASLKHQVKEV